jgi:hypothetical protein
MAQQGSPATTDQIAQLAKAFVVDLTLGDLEKMPELARPEDLPNMPKPKGSDAEGMMKFKDQPQFAKIRSDLAEECIKAAAFSQPTIAPNGQSAVVTMSVVPAEAKSFAETKMIYELFLLENLHAQQNGKSPPTQDSITSLVKSPYSLLQLKIDLEVHTMLNRTAPSMTFVNTPLGWRMNIHDYFNQKL